MRVGRGRILHPGFDGYDHVGLQDRRGGCLGHVTKLVIGTRPIFVLFEESEEEVSFSSDVVDFETHVMTQLHGLVSDKKHEYGIGGGYVRREGRKRPRHRQRRGLRRCLAGYPVP